MSDERGTVRNPDFYCSRTKRNGEPCSNYAIRGGTVCHKHGGAASQVRASADRNLAERALTKQVSRLLPSQPVTPIADAEKELRAGVAAIKAMLEAYGSVLADAGALTDAAALDLHSNVLGKWQSLMKDFNAGCAVLMQHGSPSPTDDEPDSGYERLAALMDEMEAQRDANMIRCGACEGVGYLPKWHDVLA